MSKTTGYGSTIVEYSPCTECKKVMVGRVYKKYNYRYLCSDCRAAMDRNKLKRIRRGLE